MSFLSKKLFYPNRIRIICFICVVSILLPACKKKVLEEMNSFDFKSKLSEYAIFQGEMKALKPSANFHLYELSSTLYTDMAEKQRLVFLPPGSLVTVNGNGPVDFPEGTILVKTFYYFNDKRDPSLGLKIQETRLLIKSKNTWAVATYRWNEAQTDAQLLSSGFSTSFITSIILFKA